MSKILMLGLVTSGIASINEGEAALNKMANQSRGDIGGFVVEGTEIVQMLELGLNAGMLFGGRVNQVKSFITGVRNKLPQVTKEVKVETKAAPVAAKVTPKAAPVKATKDLKTERKAAGVSQELLGEYLGVSRKVISKWENQGTTPENLKEALAILKQIA